MKDERAAVQQNIQRIQQMKSHVNNYASNVVSSAAGESRGPGASSDTIEKTILGVDTMVQLIEYVTTQQTQLDESLNQESARLANLHQRISTLDQELLQLQPSSRRSGPNASRDVTISINSNEANTYMEITLSYIVPNASWTPSYDMRLSSADQSMTLVYYGQVTQRTGEVRDQLVSCPFDLSLLSCHCCRRGMDVR